MSANKSKQMLKAVALGLMVFAGSEMAQAQTWYRVNSSTEVFDLQIDTTEITHAHAGEITLTPYVGNNPGGVESPLGVVAAPTGTVTGPIIHTVCVDILGDLNNGYAYNFGTTGFAGQSGQNPHPWGVDTGGADAAQAIQNAAYLYDNLKSTLAGGSASEKAGVQLAIWAALYNTGAGQDWTQLDTGRFHVNSGDAVAKADAVTYLSTLLGANGNSPNSYDGNLMVTTNPNINAQEVLVPVPEPTTVLAGMLLLLPFGASTIRHLRRNTAQGASSTAA